LKKSFLIITAIILIIIFIVLGYIFEAQAKQNEVISYNKQYENYLEKEIYGAEIATIINKVTEQNERNNVAKDENGYYIDNETNSIKIDLKMITIEKTYPMELIYKNDITSFVKNFNVILFKCTNIEYHKKTGKVSKLIFEQIEK